MLTSYIIQTLMLMACHIAAEVASSTGGGDGMATTLVLTTRAYLSQLGLGFLASEFGLELFGQTVHSSRALTVAAVFDLQRPNAYYEEQGGVPPLSLVALNAEQNQG